MTFDICDILTFDIFAQVLRLLGIVLGFCDTRNFPLGIPMAPSLCKVLVVTTIIMMIMMMTAKIRFCLWCALKICDTCVAVVAAACS